MTIGGGKYSDNRYNDGNGKVMTVRTLMLRMLSNMILIPIMMTTRLTILGRTSCFDLTGMKMTTVRILMKMLAMMIPMM